VSGGRLEHAIAAFLRQGFSASIAAIVGFVDILIEDACGARLADLISDLARMRVAGAQLAELITEVADPAQIAEAELAQLRHDLRTPLNAIKGYGELLVEEAQDSGHVGLLSDLGKVIDLTGRLLAEIDRIGEPAATPPVDIVGTVLRTIRPLGQAEIAADPNAASSHILIVDDNASNRDLLARRLVREGHRVTAAESGVSALALAAAESFDLVLLDLMMPGMSGFEVLCRLKADASTRHIPVIMISALDELDSTVRCIEAGAEEYLPKPFNPVLLRARIGASLEKKRLLDELRAEKERSEALLLNILPRTVVDRVKRGATVIADRFADVTILFSDLVDFTTVAARLSPEETVGLLELIFCRFDSLAARYDVEKIKTTGDGYMAAGGLPEARSNNVVGVAELALAMLDTVEAARRATGEPLQLRVGLHTGGLVAGVIGTHKFAYDVWGDTVNTAKRMETYGLPGRVHVSAAPRLALGDAFRFEPRGLLEVKGKGPMETYFLYRL
jgi:class 3 adenylate cyclase/ActR/RegA family two-component response regulator